MTQNKHEQAAIAIADFQSAIAQATDAYKAELDAIQKRAMQAFEQQVTASESAEEIALEKEIEAA